SGVTTGGMMPRNGGSVSSDIAAFNQLMFARLLIRPCAVHDRLQVEFARIEHNMLDALSSPRVCNMYESVAGLDHRRVGITIRTIVVFKHERRLPLLAIGRNGDVQRAAALVIRVVVINQKLPAIGKRNRIGTGTGV